MPVRPFLLARDGLRAVPGKAFAADADAVAHRASVAEYEIKICVWRVDDDRAGRFARWIAHDLATQIRGERSGRVVLAGQCLLLRHHLAENGCRIIGVCGHRERLRQRSGAGQQRSSDRGHGDVPVANRVIHDFHSRHSPPSWPDNEKGLQVVPALGADEYMGFTPGFAGLDVHGRGVVIPPLSFRPRGRRPREPRPPAGVMGPPLSRGRQLSLLQAGIKTAEAGSGV